MSTVTSTILAFSVGEDEHDRLADVNGILGEGLTAQQVGRFVPLPREAVGGTKALERHTFIAAFNYLDLEHLISGLRRIQWKYPGQVQLIVCEQEDDLYWIAYGPSTKPR